MKRQHLAATLLSAALLGAPVLPRADDIDLYTGGESVTGAPVNVLIVLDNSSNWASASQHWPDGGKQGVSELETISEVIGTLSGEVNVGLMTFAQNGTNLEGQVRLHIRAVEGANRTRFQSVMTYMAANAVGGSDPDEVSSSTNYDILMNSAFRYFNGKARYPGIVNAGQDRKDHRDNTTTAVFDPDPNPSGYAWAYETATASEYEAPGGADAGCAKNYIIFIGNGFPSNIGSATELTDAAALIGKTADTTQVVSISPRNPYADEWARFMYRYGVKTDIDDPLNPGEKIYNGITTFAIDVCKDACDSSQEALLRSMSEGVGGGMYFKSTSKAEIKAALADIFARIQAVNSVFASATLPISVNTQGTYENQVYIGVFRPDGNARPRWYGNLKEYQFARYCDLNGDDLVNNVGATTGDERIDGNSTPPTCSGDTLKLYLADRNNKPAIDQFNGTGFIDIPAASFWTTSSSFWTFKPSLTGSTSDSPDGPEVEKGGAGQRLRATWEGSATAGDPDGRKIYTCLGTCLGTSGTALNGHRFTTANTEVTTALSLAGGPKSVNLVRVGNTVTATSTLAHGFTVGDSVTISGANETAYNGAFTVLTAPSTTTFTYSVSETPATSVTGATLSTSGATAGITSLTLSTTTPGATATVSASTAFGVPAGTTTATITGADQAYLNGTFSGSTTAGGVFQYTVVLPAAPPASQGGLKAICGTAAQEDVTGTWAANVFTFSGTGSGGNLAGCKSAPVGTAVTISNAPAGSPYNGTFSVTSSGAKTFTVTYVFTNAVSPDVGASKQITPAASSQLVDISRTVGATTATATLQSGTHSLGVGAAITVSGSSDSTYNGTWTVLTVPDATRVTFGSFIPGPATPATGTITAALTGFSGTGPTTTNLIDWTRGRDLWENENKNFNADGTRNLNDVRASIHGDVLHSRPLLINYGGSIGIVGFYGSNDVFLRSVKGGKLDTDGGEKWAFIPQEFMNYAKLSRLYENEPRILFPNTTCGASPTPTKRNYFWDGQITAYVSPNKVDYTDVATGTTYQRPEKTYIFAAMRRGGRTIYALDVSDPDNPKYLWKIDNSSTGFGNLGYTWSEPKVTRIKARLPGPDGTLGTADDVDDTKDVLIFGGGYDPTEDDQPSGCPRGDRTSYSNTSVATCPNSGSTYSGIGRGIYVVDLMTGALLKHVLPTGSTARYSVPADVALFDLDGDGTTDRVYAGDSGAQLFRVDFNSAKRWTDSDFHTIYLLARFGDTDRNGGTDARKFLFPPEPVPFTYTRSDGSTASAIMVLAGTGDREKPLNNRSNDGSTRNNVTCSTLFPGDSYFGNRVYDKVYGYVDTVATGTLASSVTAATQSDMHEVTPEFSSSTASDLSVASFDMCLAFETTCNPPTTNPIKKGWLMNLRNTVDGDTARDEEKMVSAPRVVSGLLLFGTNTPQRPDSSSAVCSNLGQARSYAINPFTGAPSFDRNADGVIDQRDYSSVVSGGGLPPTVTAGVVGIDGSFYRFVIGAGGTGTVSTSPIAGAKNPITVRGDRSRVYWYTPVDER